MIDVLGVAVGLIGGGVFYKVVSTIFRKINFSFDKNLILPVAIYVIGFLLTVTILSPIIVIIGGTFSLLLRLIKLLINICLVLAGVYVICFLVKRIFK